MEWEDERIKKQSDNLAIKINQRGEDDKRTDDVPKSKEEEEIR